ncbi:hypothetical protein GE21DRAFT_9463 [Neurospora crassa]|uniref:Uncharacterized protein n=2 Tax=Neurospora crassa TaxID=5141 RepID=Q1K5A0_NEUCR|nr:hypothetical protein NCU05141 [Neurospora crassa OR74A]EAA27403.2 hypothetical protein NCU05141 [Neurospora crassa OR74A]KHE88011.1 hypothetical protein GE21DRAFT_9463 [Neurospora crassa]|eukprot:XP_956639.2 hypothetical protein NCU05141 [Neurospora crassa OR74A]
MTYTQQQPPANNTMTAVVEEPERAHVSVKTKPGDIEMAQPGVAQPMDPIRPHDDSTTIGLRGGDRGGMCPGRFCFCIPCPIPCDCCFIPL